MAAELLATTMLENKAGVKVAASEALKGKVVALYVRLALNRISRTADATRQQNWHRPPLGCRQFSAHWCPPCRGAQHALAIRGGAVLCARLS